MGEWMGEETDSLTSAILPWRTWIAVSHTIGEHQTRDLYHSNQLVQHLRWQICASNPPLSDQQSRSW